MSVETSEERISKLKQQIIGKMIENGADPTSPVQIMGIGVVRVASDTDMEGFTSLILHCNGKWSLKFGMDDVLVLIPDKLDEVFIQYSEIVDPESRGILELNDDLERSSKGLQYLQSNRNRLAKGLIASLETTLQDLS